jgi:hypothetical protein
LLIVNKTVVWIYLFVDGCIVESVEVHCLFSGLPKSAGTYVGLKNNCTVLSAT